MGADDPNRRGARHQALRARLAQADLAALLVTKPANVRYLTGFAGSYGALLPHDLSGAAVDWACREVIGRVGLGEAFGHSAGHGIGLEIHEAPRVRVGANGRISTGTPVTVEPGVYLPGFGGVRIEDLAVVRPGGHDVLTTATKELLEL